MPINIVIAEDQRLFRESVKLLLERERDLQVVGEARDGQEAYRAVQLNRPDVVLMDVDMPKLDGVAATRLILKEAPDIKVLMLSVHDDDQRISSAIQAGASGYILKDADFSEFLRIIRGICHNQDISSPFLADRLISKEQEGFLAASHERLTALTEREKEILSYAAQGQENKQIADGLCVSLDTVKTHLHHIYHKLGVSGRVEAILLYVNAQKFSFPLMQPNRNHHQEDEE